MGITLYMNEKLLTPKKATSLLGITTKTLQNWDKEGKIKIIRTPTNQRMIPQSEINRIMGESPHLNQSKIVVYARVSSNEQKKKGDLDRQVNYIKNQLNIDNEDDIIVVTDVGSGLNDKRKGLVKIMNLAIDKKIFQICILYKDRLTRFSYNYLKIFFESHGVTIRILSEESKEKTIQEELVDDLLSIVTCFSGKLYGLRSKKKKLAEESIKKVINNDFIL